MLCPLEHPSYRSKLILGQKIGTKYIRRKLNGDFPYILGLAPALLPNMFQVLSTYQNQLIITDFLYAVTDNPAYSFAMLYKVQLELLVLMKRIGEFGLVTLHDIEAVLLRKTRYFCKYLAHASILYYPATNIQNLKN